MPERSCIFSLKSESTNRRGLLVPERRHVNTTTKTRIAGINSHWHVSKHKVHKLQQRYILKVSQNVCFLMVIWFALNVWGERIGTEMRKTNKCREGMWG